MEIQNEKTYDSVFWASVSNWTEWLIPLVNEAFGEHFSENAVVHLDSGKQSNQRPDGSFTHRELDALVTLIENNVSKQYHFEVESKTNNGIFIRIAEYGLSIAQNNLVVTERGIEFSLPNSAVIFLRKADHMPKSRKLICKGDIGEAIKEIPIIKIQDYTIDDLFEKKLLLLLPFFGFNFTEKFVEMEQNGISELRTALDEINSRLVEMVANEVIDESDHSHWIDWTKQVLDKLTLNYENVSKGVDEIMGEYILHTRTDEILDKGRAEGETRGRSKERTSIITNMLENGKSPQAIADFCGFPLKQVQDIQAAMMLAPSK